MSSPDLDVADRLRLASRRAGFPLADDVISELQEYSRRTLAELEAIAQFTLRKPYGRNVIIRLGDTHGFSVAHILPGQGTSFHYHDHRRELFLVRAGQLRLTCADEQETILNVGDVGWSTPGTGHRLSNPSQETFAEIVETFSPPNLDDKCRLSDRYDRSIGYVTHRQ